MRSTSRPLGFSISKRTNGRTRLERLAPLVSTMSSSFSICLRRLCACLLLDACEPKRCTKSCSSPIFFLALCAVGLGALLVLVLGGDEVGVVARVDGDGPVVDVGDVRRDGVQEVPVVRDDEERALVLVGQEPR